MKKRLLSLLLTLSMVVSFFPGMTLTASAAGDEAKWAVVDVGAAEPAESAYTNSGTLAGAFEEAGKNRPANQPKVVYVKLVGDVERTEGYQMPQGKALVLDLNGHTISINTNTTSDLKGIELKGTYSELTIKNTKQEGSITVKNAGTGATTGIYVGTSFCKLNISNCTLQTEGPGSASGYDAVRCIFATSRNTVVTLENCVMRAFGNEYDTTGIALQSSASAMVTGCTIEANGTASDVSAISQMMSTTLTVSNSTLQASTETEGKRACGINNMQDTGMVISGDTTITGGTADVRMTNKTAAIDASSYTGSDTIYIDCANHTVEGAEAVVANVTDSNKGKFRLVESQGATHHLEQNNNNLVLVKGMQEEIEEPEGKTYKFSELKNGDVLNAGDKVTNDIDQRAILEFTDCNCNREVVFEAGQEVTVADNYDCYHTNNDESDYKISSESWTVVRDDTTINSVVLVKTEDYKFVDIITDEIQVALSGDHYTITIDREEGYKYFIIPQMDPYYDPDNDLEFTYEQITEMMIPQVHTQFGKQLQTAEDMEDGPYTEVTEGSVEIGSSVVAMVLKAKKVENVDNKTNNHLMVGMACVATDGIVRSVTINDTENGTVTASATEAKDFATVTLTATPADGYKLDSLTVKDAKGNDVTVEDGNFTMPRSAVTVTAVFVEDISEPAHKHCICGGDTCDEHDNAVEWMPWNSATTLPDSEGHYYLTTDVELSEPWQPDNETLEGTFLCLNGHIVTQNQDGPVIRSDTAAVLTLTDCDHTTTYTFNVDKANDGIWVLAEGSSGEKTVTGGVITGGNNSGVSFAAGTFNMYGGNIVGNRGGNGGGIYTTGTVNIYGGTICGNVARDCGGGIGSLYRNVNMYGGVVTENTSLWIGGGVYFAGDFNVQGAPVIDNNWVNGKENNVELCVLEVGELGEPTGNLPVIRLRDKLTDGAQIGVTITTSDFFTEGWSFVMDDSADPADYFFSDNTNYTVVKDKAGENEENVPYYEVRLSDGSGNEPTGTTYKWSEIKAGQTVKPGDVIVNDTEDDFDFDIADRNYYDFIYIKSGEKCTVLDKYVAEWDFDEDGESDSYTIESDSWTWMKDDEGELILVKTADAKYIQPIDLKIEQNKSEKFTVTFTPEAGFTYLYIPEEDLCDSDYSDEELAEEIKWTNKYFAAMRQTTMSLPENLADKGMVVATNGSFEVDSSMMGMLFKVQKVDDVVGKSNNHLVTGVVCFMTGGIERDITVAKTENGTVTASVSKAKDRDTVSLTVVPADGYVLESLTVLDAEGEEVFVEDGNFIMPRSAVTVTAEFIAATYSVTVNITEATEGSEDPSACTNATVTLVPLTGDPLTTEHSGEGVYTFENVAAGTYNLVIEKGTKGEEGYKVKTILAEVKGENKTVDVSLPAMNVNSKVDVTVSGNSPITGAQVGGLNDLADKLAEQVEKPDGATVDIDVAMNIETKMSTEVDTSEKADIEAKAQAQSQNLTFLDIKITQTTTTKKDGEDDDVKKDDIHDTTDLLKIVIPFDTANRSDFAVYRYHTESGGFTENVQKLVASNNISKERIEVGDGVIIMYVRYFSTYAIGYSEGNGTTPTPPTPPASGTPDYSGGSSSPNNSVTAPKTENGKVTITPKNASKGSTVKITATPDEGYELDTLTVTDKNGKAIAVTDLGNGTYSFIMPSGNVTVKATFRAVTEAGCAGDETCPIHSYTDISTTAWYHDGVHYCVENGLMSGLPGQLFAPNGTTTRAQIVTILWNLEGTPVESGAMRFNDVAASQWYAEAVRWAAANGIVTGLSEETFAPNAAVTREQLVTILRNYAQYKEIDVSEEMDIISYTDALSVSAWAMPAIQWACGSGVISGLPDGNALKLDPQGTATRAQVATMMMNFCENIVK